VRSRKFILGFVLLISHFVHYMTNPTLFQQQVRQSAVFFAEEQAGSVREENIRQGSGTTCRRRDSTENNFKITKAAFFQRPLI